VYFGGRLFAVVVLQAGLFIALTGVLAAQENPQPEPASTSSEESQPELAVDDGEASQRTQLNLLGQVDSASGEGRRNENVSLTLIDNNVLKELNQRMGTTATIVEEFEAERKYFGAEFGGSPSSPLHVGRSSPSGVHGTASWTHNNSIFSARSFFQVGGVQPSRSNDYGGTLTTSFWTGGFLTVGGGQRKLRGQVNGNILVPGANERTPTATDPATLAIVEGILAGFPSALPNRTDISSRALNTNDQQNIDDHRASATYEQDASTKDRLIFRYNITLQTVNAFQLVAGQNPDTTTKNHDARTTWSRVWNPATTTDFSAGYARVSSVLTPDQGWSGPNFVFSRVLESVGPRSNIPLDRAQNTFRYAGRLQRTSGNHTLNAGFELLRRQINGSESSDHRGQFSFRDDFGRTRIENFLAGTPSGFRVAIGDSHRGFRVWSPSFFIGDTWRATSRLTLNTGLRYEIAPAPREVNGLSEIPYDCDCNNIAPSFGFAYRINDKWGVIRASYGVQYGEIFSATFMQTRFNPPGILKPNLNAPNLADPLSGFNLEDLDPNLRSDYSLLDPELSTPYSHQYNFTWEMRPYQDWVLGLSYVGSRSHKLLAAWTENRAQNIAGMESTSSNVNERRPDPRYSDVYHILNGSRSFYDAAKITLRAPNWAGLSIDAAYWWSKAIDLGADYTGTAFGRDARGESQSPYEFDVHGTMRGLSNFDQPHAFLLNTTYQTPSNGTDNPIVDRIVGAWQLNGVLLLKSGSPFTLRSGSDGPGFGNVDGGSSDRPNVIDPSVLGAKVDHPDKSSRLLPSTAFAFQSIDQIAGNLGSNTFRKDGIWNVNFALSRQFALKGDTSLRIQVESLNLLNHAQFEEPGTTLTDSNFGQITNTLNDGRTFQFTLGLSF
jgi:hypothetical protein